MNTRSVGHPARLLFAAGAMLLLAACASGGGTVRSGGARDAEPRLMPPQVILPPNAYLLTEPMEITSSGGVLDVTVAAVFKTLVVPEPFNGDTAVFDTMTLRTYQVLRVVNGADTIDYSDSTKYGFPGPTLRVFPGDSVHLVLKNRMWDTTSSSANPQTDTANTVCAQYPAVQQTPPVDQYQDCFHGNNWTNIHFHGMHVTPAAHGDDVLALIPPGSDYEYGFRIPGNQSPGTHWYHPHKHGSVALQVLNGMSGALIVDGGPLDTLADASHMREHLIALQQIDTVPNLFTSAVFGQDFLVNGQATPVIVMAPGEVQRWRIVNENVTKTNNFEILFADGPGEEPSIYEVARDGVTYANANYATTGGPEQDTTVLMAPGNRLDVFVQAPQTSGLFAVQTRLVGHAAPLDRTRKERLAGRPRAEAQAIARASLGSGEALPNTGNNNVFYVLVDPTLPATTSQLPSSLPALPWFLANLPGSMDSTQILSQPATLPVIVFTDSGFGAQTQQQPPRYFLGTAQNPNMKFNDTVTYVPQNAAGASLPMVLDSVQTWKVENWSTSTNHPFHIHINPFQVVSVSYPQGANDPNADLYADLNTAAQTQGSPIWLDVLPLPMPVVDTVAADTTGTGGNQVITLVKADTTPGYALIRQAYQPFMNTDSTKCTNCGDPTGWFVMHCHILGHEERGMMQVLEIVPTGRQPSRPPPGLMSAGHNHPSPAPAPGSGSGGGEGRGGGGGGGGGHHH